MSQSESLTSEELSVSILENVKAFSRPINLNKVMRKYNIELHEVILEDEVSGMLVIKENTKHIIVNKLHPPNRKNFTIAHELGHLFLHHKEGEDKLFIDKKTYHRASKQIIGTSSFEEREANIFASCLLMPKALIKSYIIENFNEGVTELDEYDISKLALEFEVSEQAMMIRLKTLGYQVIDKY